jgi:hypothetical protein
MGFASTYLEERAIFPRFINDPPHRDTGIIVVVPSYSEPGIPNLLDSLASCDEPSCKAEIMIVVNAPAGASEECLGNNRNTIRSLENWRRTHKSFFNLHIIDTTTTKLEGWGVGMARKTGMDEAVRRFNLTARPEGVILSLDADCTVEKNYFTAITEGLLNRKERSACSVYFEHPLSGDEFPETVYKSITQYELHLRYYFQGLAYTGFPYVHHTVGSSMAVKALPYVRAGGMNRRMAGEDFYFIQKLVSAGGYFNLNQTTVYPSPRSSFRVPFGTGVAISKLSSAGDDLLKTYNLGAFKELKKFFGMSEEIFKCQPEELGTFHSSLPPGIKQFVGREEWSARILEIKNNTNGLRSFEKRFFSWFNMFRIVKYLNSVHDTLFSREPVTRSASSLLYEIGVGFESADPVSLLRYYRMLERPT